MLAIYIYYHSHFTLSPLLVTQNFVTLHAGLTKYAHSWHNLRLLLLFHLLRTTSFPRNKILPFDLNNIIIEIIYQLLINNLNNNISKGLARHLEDKIKKNSNIILLLKVESPTLPCCCEQSLQNFWA